jgi:hypothetical protein
LVNQLKKHLSFEFIGGTFALSGTKYRVAPFKMIAGHDTTAGFSFIYSKKIHFLMLTFH